MKKSWVKKAPEIQGLLQTSIQVPARTAWNELVSEFSAETEVECAGASVFFLELPWKAVAPFEQSAWPDWILSLARGFAPEDRALLETFTAPRRRLEFSLGRSLKALCLAEDPGAHVSLSHSVRQRGGDVILGCVAVSLGGASARSGGTRLRIGVDLEAKERGVSDGVFRKLIPDAGVREAVEREGALARVRAWCEREALWKSNPMQDQGLLLDYQRGGQGRYAFRGGASPRFWTRSSVFGDWVLAFALGSQAETR